MVGIMPVDRKVNNLILEKVDKSKYDDNVKAFVKEILLFERNHFDAGLARYKTTYRDSADKFYNESGKK
jgi:hypothetical protein